MSSTVIIIQIMFITIGMTIIGMILNRVLGLRKENLKNLREKAQNIQDRIRNAQLLNDYQLIMQLQRESMIFMKTLMKKQLIPMCVRCIIFIGIFGILGLIYADYSAGLLPFPILIFGDGWFAIYFLFSIGFALSIYGIKRLYKKLTGKETKSQNKLRELMGMITPAHQGTLSTGSQYLANNRTPSLSEEERQDSSNSNNTWKDRIEK
ncbi:hypothetical protein LCGC14_0965560 [marine sediment metagenome]|uniref:DUF106 domain-containing protein n=1 Tax=marine sediment metagenome TaxID=412755 RepID=A0A0F9NHN8_9ZZZZ